MLTRPFRFAGSSPSTATGKQFSEAARKIEALGYDTLLVADHFEQGWFAAGSALAAAATATTTLRALPLEDVQTTGTAAQQSCKPAAGR